MSATDNKSVTPLTDANAFKASWMTNAVVSADFTRRLEIALNECRAECDALRKDARRYRWLREQSTSFEDEWYEAQNGAIIRTVRSAEYLDEHVDAAIEQERKT